MTLRSLIHLGEHSNSNTRPPKNRRYATQVRHDSPLELHSPCPPQDSPRNLPTGLHLPSYSRHHLQQRLPGPAPAAGILLLLPQRPAPVPRQDRRPRLARRRAERLQRRRLRLVARVVDFRVLGA